MKTTEVNFFSEGDRIAGLLSLPATPRPAPGVVLAHGYSNDKHEFGGFDTADDVLTAAGYAVLRFDFRGCGESAGIPGRMLVSTQWPSDLRSAISYLRTRPEVDPTRIGLVGNSMGGGMVTLIASTDPRVRCAVSWAGVSDGERWQREIWTAHYGEQGWRAFLAQIEADRARRVLTGNSERRSLAETLAQNAEETAFLDEMAARFPAYRNEIELESADNTLAFRPVDALTHCQCPILFVHGTEDLLVLPDHALAMHKQAGAQSELALFEGAGHDLAFGPYQGEVRSLTLAWLARHLAPEAITH